MADAQIIFTPNQQLALQELEKQVNGFTAFKNLVSRSLYQGQDALLASQLLSFLNDLISQSMKQIKQIQDDAKAQAEQDSSPVALVKES